MCKNIKTTITFLALTLALVALSSTAHAETSAAQDDVNAYLRTAKYEEGIKVYTEKAAQSHQQADLFSLATLQFINATQNVVQGLYRFGLKSDRVEILPLAIIPIPKNPKPQTVHPEDLALLAQNWYDALTETDKTLAQMSCEEFKVRIDLGQAVMDVNSDGRVDETENLMLLCSRWFGNRLQGEARAAFYLNCDRADAVWLQGYCKLLMGLLDILQAHDWNAFYAKTAHTLFESPEKGTLAPYTRPDGHHDVASIIDIVLLIHELHLEVVHPERYKQAREHFLDVIRLSRAFWEAVLKETDDDHEWIPNTQQTASSGAKVTPQMIIGWHFFLNEMESILQGRKLIPHFRIKQEYGINLAKVVENPRALDLVEWVSGLAAVPYLEKGEVIDPNNWETLSGIFSGRFMRTALWFN